MRAAVATGRGASPLPEDTPMRLLHCVLAGLLASFAIASSAAPETTTYEVRPSSTDPRIRHDDFLDWVMFDRHAPPGAPLVLFMPGTHGRPGNRHELPLMNLIVAQGYRLAWISFDNDISVSKVCPHAPDADCSAKFRRMRVDGTGPAPVDNPPAESVVSRLTHLLQALARAHPGEGWDGYLAGGMPDWKRIVVSGHSTGAGMAAYIAKTREVARVVLFSSPWDDVHPPGQPSRTAPWLSMPGATPVDRWYAEYNRRENTARLIADAYAALRIPAGHVHVFSLDLPADYAGKHARNPYHTVTIRDARYAAEWRAMFGKAPAAVPPA